MTAIELLNSSNKGETFYGEIGARYFEEEVEELMIEFAKMHVEKSLLEASKNIKFRADLNNQGVNISLIKASILNAYNLDEIK